MKIVISLILLALVVYFFRKFSNSNKKIDIDTPSSSTVGATLPPSEPNTGGSSSVANTAAIAAAASASTQSKPKSTLSRPLEQSQANHPLELPVEHLFGINRSLGKTLRSAGVFTVQDIVRNSTGQLEAIGINRSEAKKLHAQASLSTLPGATPHEIAALVESGVESLQSLANQQPSELLAKIARTSRNWGTLKSPLGSQQLRRLIESAKAAS